MVRIVVVGGGSAGWTTASYIKNSIDCELTVIHEEQNNPIGVGETVTPTLRLIAENANISENVWLKDSDATFKYGIKFNDWNYSGSVWYHLFEDAFEFSKTKVDSVEYCINNLDMSTKYFNLFHGPQQYLLDKNLTPYPKTISDRPGHAYQILADKFGATLQKHLNDYTLITSGVKDVCINENGIEFLRLENGQTVYGDVFFDCSGFNRVLISKLSDYESYDDMICNKFVAGKVRGVPKQHKIYTELTAKPDGWLWDVNTRNRTAGGFIYSDYFTTDDEARKILKDAWNGQIDFVFDCIKYENGSMKTVAVDNCISNGLAQSFIEPMEATSLMLTCVTVINFVDQYKKKKKWTSKESKVLSRHLKRFLKHSKEFVKYHYTLSDRTDSEFWRYWNNQQNIEEYNDYLNMFLSKKRYCKKGETIFNHFNLASMLIGYEKPYLNKTKNMKYVDWTEPDYDIDYSNNITHDDFLTMVHI